MGFALIFYGLNLITGGLEPLRKMPDVLEVIQTQDAGTYRGVISCIPIAALIHSSSATIGSVFGLGASGILSWETAIAFAVGADFDTTIASWMASLNLSKDAKRAADAHISFKFLGVSVVLLLFLPAIWLLKTALAAWGIDPGAPVMVGGRESFPGVPIAVGVFSIVFDIFNFIILFPFVNTFERYQIARRVKRTPFSPAARRVVDASMERLDGELNRIPFPAGALPDPPVGHSTPPSF